MKKLKSMKKLLVFAFSMAILASCNSGGSSEQQATATADTAAAPSTGTFGAAIDESGALPMDSLLAMVSSGQAEINGIKVSGTITEACQAKGCWMKIDKGDGQTMRVVFKDYGFFVPKDCGGKTAVMLGRAYMDTTSVEDLRHYAEDAGKSKEEIEKITQPEVELAFEAEGVIIK
jgi:hypothetical protein